MLWGKIYGEIFLKLNDIEEIDLTGVFVVVVYLFVCLASINQ